MLFTNIYKDASQQNKKKLNIYIYIYIYIFIAIYLLHVSVFVTPFPGKTLRYLLKNCMRCAMLLHKLYYKIQYIPSFKIYNACYNDPYPANVENRVSS